MRGAWWGEADDAAAPLAATRSSDAVQRESVCRRSVPCVSRGVLPGDVLPRALTSSRSASVGVARGAWRVRDREKSAAGRNNRRESGLSRASVPVKFAECVTSRSTRGSVELAARVPRRQGRHARRQLRCAECVEGQPRIVVRARRASVYSWHRVRARHARIRPRATISLAEREGVPSVEMCLQSRDYSEIASGRVLTPKRAASSGGPSIRDRRAR